jgi:MFS transporter, NNP family, nitrate/nitrite transporter
VGAGGNAGAVTGMFLFKMDGVSWSTAFLYLGMIVASASFLALLIRFSPEEDAKANKELEEIAEFAKVA